MARKSGTLILVDVLGKITPFSERTTAKAASGHPIQTMRASTKGGASVVVVVDASWPHEPCRVHAWGSSRHSTYTYAFPPGMWD